MEGYKTTLCFPEFEASSIYAMQHHHSTAKSDRQEIAWTVHEEMCSSNQSYSTEEPGKMNLPLLVQQLHRHIGIHGCDDMVQMGESPFHTNNTLAY